MISISEPATCAAVCAGLRATRLAGAGCGAPTCAGRRIVKVEPRPSSLRTVMSPPIIWQKRRLMARPRPVPPYLRVVEASACTNSWNRRPI